MNRFNKILQIVSLIVVATGLSFCQGKPAGEAKGKQDKIDASGLVELKKMQPEVVLIDLRTPQETASGIIEGAQIIDFNDPKFQSSIESLEKDKTYVVYCAAGGRSGKAFDLMKKMGFTNVIDYSGGMSDWKSKGLPVVNQ